MQKSIIVTNIESEIFNMSGKKETIIQRPVKPEVKKKVKPSSAQQISHLNNQMQAIKHANSLKQNRLNQMSNQMNRVNADNKKLRQNSQKIVTSFNQYREKQRNQIDTMNNKLHAERKATEQAFQKTQNQLLNIKQNQQNQIQSIREQIKNSNQQQKQALMNQEQKLKSLMMKEIEETRNTLHASIDKQNKVIQEIKTEFQTQILEVKHEFQSQLSRIENEIKNKEQNQYDLALDWIESCQYVFDHLKNTKHHVFKPGKLETYQRDLTQIVSMSNASAYQSMIVQAIQLFNNLKSFYDEIFELEMTYQEEYFELQDRISKLVSKVNDLKHLTYENEESSSEIEVDVNYWTKGKLSDIVKVIEEDIISPLEQSSEFLSIEELKQLQHLAFKQVNELNELEEEAKEQMLLSQMRVQMGKTIDSVMQTIGYHLVDYTYEHNDQRNGFYVKLADGIGNEVVVKLEPTAFKNQDIKVALDFFNLENDEIFFNQATQSIVNSLKEDGIEVNQPQTVKGYETRSSDDIKLLDFESMKLEVKS